MTTMEDRLAVLYDETRRVLKEHGWCQGTLSNIEGQVCLVMALTLAANDASVPTIVHTAVNTLTDWVGQHPALWNDQPGRTYEQVEDMLKSLAAHLRAE